MARFAPPPYKTPMFGANGILTAPWAAWFRDVAAGGSETVESVADHVADATAHAANAITNEPSGNLSSTNVQSALNELQGSLDALSDEIDTIEGDSAYDVAVENGFVGTEAEWLLSLVGPTGSTGSTGPQGATGVQGPEGPPGGSINTNFAVSNTGYIYTNSLTGHTYLLEIAS